VFQGIIAKIVSFVCQCTTPCTRRKNIIHIYFELLGKSNEGALVKIGHPPIVCYVRIIDLLNAELYY
jgi:hypothetical protein